MRRITCAGLALVLQLGFVFCAFAQTGAIRGTVVDSQGAVIPGASARAFDEAKGMVVRETTSASDGVFQLQPLLPGTYTIRVSAAGMKELDRKGVVLDQNQDLTLGNLTMTLGATVESITVEATTPLVETSTSDHSAVIDSKQVTETSLNGRDFQSLVKTLPGVVTGGSMANASDFRLAFNNTDAFNVNGMRGSANNIYLDGAINTDPGANDGQYTQLSMDAVGEFKLQTANFAAEYGRNAGVLLAINTKSGGQRYHGTLYEFNREDGFDANTFFNNLNGQPKTKLRFNQFGGNVGGPIIVPKISPKSAKKLFFFYNFEGTRASKPIQGNLPTGGFYDLPNPAFLKGDFSTLYRPGNIAGTSFQNGQIFVPGTIVRDNAGNITGGTPYPNNQIPTSSFSANASAFIALVTPGYKPGFFSLASQGQPDRVRVPFQDVYNFHKNQNVLRVDFNVNAKTNFFFRWVDDSQREGQESGLFNFVSFPVVPMYRKKPGSSWAWNLVDVISPTITNEFIFSYNHLTQVVDITPGTPKSTYDRTALGFTFQELYPNSNIDNRFPTIGPCCGDFGMSMFPPGWHSEARTFTWTDNVTKVHRVHTIKTGVFFDYNQAGQQPVWTDAPNFNFSTGSANANDSGNVVANMLLGNYAGVQQTNGVFFGAFRFHQVEAYGQDTWKITRKLTLDLGLRWAYLGPTYTVQPFFANYFDPTLYNPSQAVTIQTAPGITQGSICSSTTCPGLTSYGNPFNGIVQEGHGIPPGFAQHRYDNFEPRVGFAYDPWGTGKTAIRGGFGIFHERIRQNIDSFDLLGNPPLAYTPTIFNGNVDNLSPAVAASGVRSPVQINAFDKKGQIPTTYSYSLGIQHQLPWQLGLDVAYVGNLGRHEQFQYNLEQLPVGTTTGTPILKNANGIAPAIEPYKGYTNVNFTEYGANSSYNALQARLTRRFARGLFVSADYTWSKAIDLTDGDNVGFGASSLTDHFTAKQDYAVAGFDRKHVFNANYVYTFPEFRKSSSTWMRMVTGGWEVSGVTRFWSGAPLDIYANGNPGSLVSLRPDLGLATRPDYAGGSIYASSHANLQWFDPTVFARPVDGSVGNVGRNAFRGPGINNWDISIFKNFNFSESLRLQLRLETFNTFNHTQFASVNVGFSAPNPGQQITPATAGQAGKINGARDPRNVQLGAKFYF
jgi:hypothetical protein